jgi:hypothetical protein
MTQDPSTGAGYDAVEVGSNDYFDSNATDPAYPGALGLQVRKHTFWQGDVQFDTFETVGPVMGDGPGFTIIVGGPGGVTPLGAAAGFGPHGEAPGTVVPGDPNNPATGANFGFQGPDAPLICLDEFGNPLLGIDTNEVHILLQGVYLDGVLGDLLFPVPPQTLSADFPQDNDGDTDTLSGEIVIPGTEKLESIGWTSFFPRDYNPGYCVIAEDEMTDPTTAIKALMWSKRFRLPLRLVVGGTPWNDHVIIKTLKWTINAGEPGDIYYDVQFKRYRSASVSIVTLPNAPVDPRDYPSYQGPPVYIPPPGPITPADQADRQNGDKTNPAAVPVAPKVGDPGFLDPNYTGQGNTYAPGVQPSTIGTAKPPDVIVSVEYTVGAAFNWRGSNLISGQTLSQVYEDIKSKSSLNTLDSLLAMNKDHGATSTILGMGDFSSKHVVGDYNPHFDALPLGTKINYLAKRPANAKLSPGETLTPSNVATAVTTP